MTTLIVETAKRLCGRCRQCNGLIVYSDDMGKTWRHYDGTIHKGHAVDFLQDDAVAADLPKERREWPVEISSPHERASAEENAAALALARDPALLYRIKLDLERKIYREDANKLLLFLTCAELNNDAPTLRRNHIGIGGWKIQPSPFSHRLLSR